MNGERIKRRQTENRGRHSSSKETQVEVTLKGETEIIEVRVLAVLESIPQDINNLMIMRKTTQSLLIKMTEDLQLIKMIQTMGLQEEAISNI